MLTVPEAQQRILSTITELASEDVTLAGSLGRVLREDVAAPFDVPERDNSAMDGYAIVAADVASASDEAPVELPVIEDVPAGHVARRDVTTGTASRIMTGALVPRGADAVVQVELTDAGSDRVLVMRPVKPGANIRRRGEDMRTGHVVLRSGTRIGAAEFSALAAVQKTRVRVSAVPTVAILSTGDELVSADEPRGEGRVVNSNAWALAALVREAGGEPRMLGIVRDDRDATLTAFRDAVSADFVLSSGGVSVGTRDFVKETLEALGAETHFWRVLMKPGKPLVFSTLGRVAIFGLPGNPVSCMVAFHLFVAPALRRASGVAGEVLPAVVDARLAAPLKAPGDRRTFFRVRLAPDRGELVADPAAAQGSGVLTSMIGANGLAYLDTGVTSAAAGERVPCVVIGRI